MDAKVFVDVLEGSGIRFFAGVPDSYLHGFCTELAARLPSEGNVIAANEGNAVAVAAGHYLATGSVPLVYMQNSGLGNAVNPLASLACAPMLEIPMVLLVGWRGDPEHPDHVQHELQGRVTPLLLDDLGIPFRILSEDGAARDASWAASKALLSQGPVALLAPKGILAGVKKPAEDESYPLTREKAIAAVLDAAPADALFSATTGRAARELHGLREIRGESHSRDYLNVGAMGHASSVALGLALGAPERNVVCLDGDGAAIMHMGALAVAPGLAVPNLLHVVLNNGSHESVGGQPSAGWRVDLTAAAAACGYVTTSSPATTCEEISSAVATLLNVRGPSFLEIRIRSGIRPDMPKLKVDPVRMRDELMENISST